MIQSDSLNFYKRIYKTLSNSEQMIDLKYRYIIWFDFGQTSNTKPLTRFDVISCYLPPEQTKRGCNVVMIVYTYKSSKKWDSYIFKVC